jgi:hypothetical protein
MKPIRIFLIICIVCVIAILILVFNRNENYNICDILPNLPQCKNQLTNPRIPRPGDSSLGNIPRVREPPRLGGIPSPPTLIPKAKHALCVSGGGILSFSVFNGVMASALQMKRLSTRDPYKKLSDMKFDYMSGASGGGLSVSMLAYDQKYNNDLNRLNLSGWQVRIQFARDYINEFTRLRDLYSIQDPNEVLRSVQLPYFITTLLGITSTLFDNIYGLLGLEGTSQIAKIYFLNRHNNTKVSDILPEYSHTNVIQPVSILTTGSLSFPNIQLNLSYNLPTGDECKRNLPYNHGPETSSERYGDVILKSYNANGLNNLRYWDVTPRQPPPGPVPDNTMFDTCEWVQKYEDGWFSNTPEPYKVYRCKNIAAGECCQNNSENMKCTLGSLGLYASKSNSVPFTVNGIYARETEYYAFNIETEKEPTGEWQEEVTDLIPYKARKLVAKVPTSLDRISYDTSQESLVMVTAANTSLPGVVSDPCYLKSIIYKGGFSDQEQLVERMNRITLNINPCLRTDSNGDPNKRLYKNICSLLADNSETVCRNESTSRYTRLSPDYDISIPLKEIIAKKPLNTVDGGAIDNSGVIPSIIAHQKSVYNNTRLNITNITSSINYTKALFEDSVYNDADGNITCFQDIDITVDELMVLVNDVANYNILEELGIILGAVAATAVAGGVASIISNLFGISVTVIIIASIAEIVWEILDLDTDYHEIVDNYDRSFIGKIMCRSPIVLSGSDFPEYQTSLTIQRIEDRMNFYVKLLYYENRETVENKLLGVLPGTKVNMYCITVETDEDPEIPIVPLLNSIPSWFEETSANSPPLVNINGEIWGELSRILFEGVREMYNRNGSIQQRLIKEAFMIE